MFSKKDIHGEINVNVDDVINNVGTKVISSPSTSQYDAENASTTTKASNVKFVVSVGVVIFSMIFNGTIYGYTRNRTAKLFSLSLLGPNFI